MSPTPDISLTLRVFLYSADIASLLIMCQSVGFLEVDAPSVWHSWISQS